MAVKAADGSKTNTALKVLSVATSRLGRQAKATAASGSVCWPCKKVKGCWMLAESCQAGCGRLTFCICLSIRPQKNPHWSGLRILANQCVFFPLFFLSFFFLNRACCTPQAPHVDSDYTAWQCGITSRRWGGRFFSHVLLFFFFCQHEGECCLDGVVHVCDSELPCQWQSIHVSENIFTTLHVV